MNNNFEYKQFHQISYSSSTPVRFLKIPISQNYGSRTLKMNIEIILTSGSNLLKSYIALALTQTEGSHNPTINLRYLRQSDKRIAVKGILNDQTLYLYALMSSSLSGSQCFINVITTETNQYLFENVVETIPESEHSYDCLPLDLFTFAENVEANSSFGNYSYSDFKVLNISCGVHITSALPSGTPILKSIGTYNVNGIIFKSDGTAFFPVRRVGTNLVCSSFEIPTGYYIIMANGIEAGTTPQF